MNQSDTLLKLTDIVKGYDPESPPVLKGVSLEVTCGESLAIVGPSGCGKSTLLNIIGTLDRPDSGTVLLDGSNVTGLDDKALAHLRSRKIGFVFQDHHLLPQCTALENVLIPTLAGGAPSDARQRGTQLLEAVGLTDCADRFPAELSGGQRQRVATVRALIQQPSLLLADEPTGSLDRDGAGALGELLVDLNQEQGVTLIVVTHSQTLASKMGRTLQLTDGRLSPAADLP